MAFGLERYVMNFVTEKLLKANLRCFGDYSILGYSIYEERPGNQLYTYDIYHTDLPKETFDEFLKNAMDIEDYDEVFIHELGYDEYDDEYNDELL